MRAILLAAAVTLALTSAVQAQTPRLCGDRADFVKQLAEQHKETPVAVGLQADGNLLEIYATKDGKTWTALSTTPSRKSCVISLGSAWHVTELLLGEPS